MIVVVAPRPDENASPNSRVLERGEALLERGPGRVRRARVVVALVDADRLLRVRRRLVDRRRHGARSPSPAPGRRGSRASRSPSSDCRRSTPGDRFEPARSAQPVERALERVSRPRSAHARLQVERLHPRARPRPAPPSGRRGRRSGRARAAAARSSRTPARAPSCRPRSCGRSRARGGRTAGPRAGCRTARAAPPPSARRSRSAAGRDEHRARRRRRPRPARAARRRRARRRGPHPRDAAAEPPVLDDARLGERAARRDGLQREQRAGTPPRRAPAPEQLVRDHALGQVVEPLEAVPAGDHEVAVSTARRASPSPASVPHPALARALEVREPSGPRSRISPSISSARSGCVAPTSPYQRRPPSLHLRHEERPVLDRHEARLVGPVLEQPAPREQARHGARRERADARAEREPVRAVDGRDRVELHAREPPDRLLHLARRPVRERAAYPWAAMTRRRSAVRETDRMSGRHFALQDLRSSGDGSMSRPGRATCGDACECRIAPGLA